MVVVDFRVKYKGKKHMQHLIYYLHKKYAITKDWTRKKFLGLSIDYNYWDRKITTSKKNYTYKALQKSQQPINTNPTKPSPKYKAPIYGANIK